MTPGTLEPSPAGAPSRTATAPGAPNTTESGFADALQTIRKRKWIIIIAVLLGFCYGWYKSSTQIKLYTATGTIEIGTGSSSSLRATVGAADVSSNLSTSTQVAILKSDTLLLTVARDLDLANNPDFMGAKGPMPHMNIEDPGIRQGVIGILDGDITVIAVPKTDLVKISCSTLNPKLSADIVNKLVAEYIHRSFQSRFDATHRASDFLNTQLNDLRQQVEESQLGLIDLGRKLGIVGLDASQSAASNNLTALTGAVGSAQIRRILAQSRLRVLSSMDKNAVDPTIDVAGGTAGTGNSTLTNLRSQREAEEIHYSQLTATLGPNHPTVRTSRAVIDRLDKVIAEETARLVTQAKEEVTAAKIDEDTMRGALDTERADAYKRRDDLIAYSFRQHEYESLRTLYDSLRDRLRSAGISAGLESTEIDIVDIATPPVGASLQPRSSILLMNTAVMLIVGLIIAFIVDALDTGIQSIGELEALTGLPSLALIPRGRRIADPASLTLIQRNVGVLSSPKSQFAEAFRALRTSLLLSTPGGEPKVMLLTSSTPSEGKTTAAVNLATVLAQRGVKVLLIDADLRRPAVHHRFGINAKVGLTSVLAGSATLQQAVQQLPEIPGLDVLVSGPVPPFPTEMLGSNDMHSLLEKARSEYTHILLDSPPLLSVTDAVILAHEADAVLLVVRHGKTSKHAVRRGRELLRRSSSRATGVVLNAVETTSPEYYAYYGYTGYSSYNTPGVDTAAWDPRPSGGEGDRQK